MPSACGSLAQRTFNRYIPARKSPSNTSNEFDHFIAAGSDRGPRSATFRPTVTVRTAVPGRPRVECPLCGIANATDNNSNSPLSVAPAKQSHGPPNEDSYPGTIRFKPFALLVPRLMVEQRVSTVNVTLTFRTGDCRATKTELAEREGFEPSIPFWSMHAFQACAFNHSAISPAGSETLAMREVGRNLFQQSGRIGSISVESLPDKSGVPMAIGTPHSCGSLTFGTPASAGSCSHAQNSATARVGDKFLVARQPAAQLAFHRLERFLPLRQFGFGNQDVNLAIREINADAIAGF